MTTRAASSTDLRMPGVPASGRLTSIAELAAAYANGLSPVAVILDCLTRIDARNGSLRVMITVDANGALAAAHQAEAEICRGHNRGPLHGVPIAVKDVIDVAGWPTTAGSRLFEGQIAQTDAACIANLRAAGAIILGKTNLHELTIGGHDNPWFGKVVNPLDESRGTAGSSSGSAAAVAAGLCIAALGTDTGGSNRSVAAATGLVGFKPSGGVIPTTGSRPTAPSFDTIGPITATIADARLMTEAMSGRLLTAANRLPDTVILCPDLYAAPIDPVVAQSHAAFFQRLRALGTNILTLPFPDAPAFIAAGLTILSYEFAQHYAPLIAAGPTRVGAPARAFTDFACAIPRGAYDAALALRAQTQRQFLSQLDDTHLLAIPTAPGLAPRLSDECTEVAGTWTPYGPAGGSFRRWANMLDMPTLALPLSSGQRLPASIQLAAKPGQDALLLHSAQSLVNSA